MPYPILTTVQVKTAEHEYAGRAGHVHATWKKRPEVVAVLFDGDDEVTAAVQVVDLEVLG
jgi:hypothetical protein